MNQRRAGLLIVILVLIGVSAFLIYRFYQDSTTQTNTNTNATVPVSGDQGEGRYQDSVQFPPTPPEDPEVFSYAGTIQAVNQSTGEMTLSTNRGTKIITINSDTELVLRRRPTREQRLQLSNGGVAAALSAEEPFTGVFQVGDAITAVSETNIQGVEAYTASKIIITQ